MAVLSAELTFRIMDGRKLVGKVTRSASFKPRLWRSLPYYVMMLAMDLAHDGWIAQDEIERKEEP